MKINQTTILIAIIVALVTYILVSNNTISIPNTGNHASLNVIFASLANSEVSTECTTEMGGQWIFTPNKIGCYNTLAPLPVSDICQSSDWAAISSTCDANNAHSVCDLHNIGCTY